MTASTEAAKSGVRKNPVWSRDELILALDLYMRHRAVPPGKSSQEVVELSEFLNQASILLGAAESGTFRNANGVYMKLMNFRSIDPQFTSNGKVGLTRNNKDEAVVWEMFANDQNHLTEVATAIRQAVKDFGADTAMSEVDDPGLTEAEEGKILTRLHRVRERSRKLADQCKATALKTHGHLACEACEFIFTDKYGQAGAGMIEVHHSKPVHTLSAGAKTNIKDLVLLCANCHRVVHGSRKWLTLNELRATLNSVTRLDSK